MKILVIDDETDQLERFIAIAKSLKPTWTFKGLCNSGLAPGWIIHDGYNGVICDTRMHPLSGVDIVHALAEKGCAVPLLLHSNSSRHWQGERRRPMARGEQRFILPEFAERFAFVTFHRKELAMEDTKRYFSEFFSSIEAA